jgi:hypothetical protein
MAAPGFTPIQLYYSSTATTIPTSGNLISGELAINITDGKLYYKDNSGTVRLLASNASSTGTVASVAMTVPTGLSISGSPITTTGTLAVTYASGYAIPTTAKQTEWDSAFTQRLQWDGGATNLVATTGRTSLGGTTIGQSVFTLTNPSAITFPRFNADNTVSALDAATFRTAIGAGTSSTTGTVTSVALSGGTTGLTVSGSPITTSGTITLSGTLAVANGGTGANSFTSGALLKGSGTGAVAVASAADIVGQISTTAVTNATNATQITNSGGWSITPSGTTLFFSYDGTNVASLDSTGNLIVIGDVTAFGSV